jgi:hypothetical protein
VLPQVGFLRLKAPVLAENTYAYGSDTTSFYTSFAPTFAALDTVYSSLINGFRVVETGVTMGLADVLRTDTQTSMDPILAFADTLTLTVIINKPGLVVRYTNATFTLDSSGCVIYLVIALLYSTRTHTHTHTHIHTHTHTHTHTTGAASRATGRSQPTPQKSCRRISPSHATRPSSVNMVTS